MPRGADDEDTGAAPRASPRRSGATSPPRPVVPSVLTTHEPDVYEAETRVGSTPAAILDALREQGLDERAPQQRPTSPPPRASTNAPLDPVPRAYVTDTSDDDEDNVATRVHRDGKKVALGAFHEDVELRPNPLEGAPPHTAPPLPQLGGTLTLSAKPPALPVQPPPQPFAPPAPALVTPPMMAPPAQPPPPAPQPSFAPGANATFPMNPTYPPPFAPHAPSHASLGPPLGPNVSNKHWILIVALSFVVTLAVLGVVISRLL